MPRKFKFCLHCRRTIVENEIQRELFVQTPHGMLCATCAQKLDEETEAAKHLAAAQAPVPAESPAPQIEEKPAPMPPAKAPTPVAPDPPAALSPADPQPRAPEPPAQLLDGIRQQVEAIHRTLLFEKSSPWAVLAAVAQCLAVGMLILGAVNWADNPMHLLIVSLIFQVMALTFFVRGK
jgi:hypothetical protein